MMDVAVSYRGGFNINGSGLTGTLAANPGELKLQASITDANISNGLYFDFGGLLLSIEKPGSFIVDYDVPKKDVRFQFMNSFKFMEKQINFTYTHTRQENRTILDGSLVLDTANKLSANYALDTRNCKLKYSHVHRGLTTLEPTYDFAKNSWDLAVSRRVLDGDVIRASYETSSQILGLEWSWQSMMDKGGRYKY